MSHSTSLVICSGVEAMGQIVSGSVWLRTLHFMTDWTAFGGRQGSSVSDRDILKVHRGAQKLLKIFKYLQDLSVF